MRHLFLFLALLLVAQPKLQSAEPVVATTTFPLLLVRIMALSATGPDNAEHTLYTSHEGFVTPLQEMGRVGYQVQGGRLADGHYHTLYVELADGYQEIADDGTVSEKHLSDAGMEKRLRIRGMVLVEGGRATPLGTLEANTPHRLTHGRDDDEDD